MAIPYLELAVQISSADVPESLLRDKDEYEAYWEHYISVKEELVQNILQVPGYITPIRDLVDI